MDDSSVSLISFPYAQDMRSADLRCSSADAQVLKQLDQGSRIVLWHKWLLATLGSHELLETEVQYQPTISV